MARLAVYDVNDYVLNGTGAGALMGWPTQENIRPIVPAQQQPEMNEMNPEHPYMVYRWRTTTETDTWWEHTDELNYVIWGKSYDQLAGVANELVDAFRALDQSAGDLNDYLRANRPGGPEYIFHWVKVLASISPEPAGQEAGRIGWVVSIRYQYVPVNGRFIE